MIKKRSVHHKIFLSDPRLLEVYTGLLSIAYGILFLICSTLENATQFSVALDVFGSSSNAATIGICSGLIQIYFTIAHAYQKKSYQLKMRIVGTFAEMYFWFGLVYNFYIIPEFIVATTNYSFAVIANMYVAFVLLVRMHSDG